MGTDIPIQAVGLRQRNLLIGMYDRFESLGAALGLPPVKAGARRDWIGRALGHKTNLAAFSPAGEMLGHCFLVADKSGSPEVAIFVRQEFRRKGVGTALLSGAGMGSRLGAAACVEIDLSREPGRPTPPREVWLPPSGLCLFGGPTGDRFAGRLPRQSGPVVDGILMRCFHRRDRSLTRHCRNQTGDLRFNAETRKKIRNSASPSKISGRPEVARGSGGDRRGGKREAP